MKQPKWCNYPNANQPIWGCWSLLDGLVKNEDYCKNCDCYKNNMNHKKDIDVLAIVKSMVADGAITQDVAEKYFPQLAESEDERIRIMLIEWVNEFRKLNPTNADHNGACSEAIAYLEKQKDTYIKQQLRDMGFAFDSNGDIVTPDILNEAIKEYVANEKKKWEKEQKPTDKIEPKFEIEEGKWYICTQTYVLSGKIVAIKGQTYKSNQDGAIEGEDRHLFIDKVDGKALNYFKPWTIQDAKDGDVLEFGDHGRLVVGIVSYINKSTGKIDVCCLLEDNNFKVGNYYALDTIKPHPATKEQRDLLFSKMKEDGYEWDAEKKELKKINQKPIKITYDENGEPELSDFESELFTIISEFWQSYMLGEEVDVAKFVKEHSSELLGVVEHKPAEWSEEDERNLNTIVNVIYGGTHLAYEEEIDWLKSLKERILNKTNE